MKNKIKIIIAFVLGAIIFGSIGVYAATQILSKDISYTKKDGSLTNVEDALTELYEKNINLSVPYNNLAGRYTYSNNSNLLGTWNAEKGNYLIMAAGAVSEYKVTYSITGCDDLNELVNKYIDYWGETANRAADYRQGRGTLSYKIYSCKIENDNTAINVYENLYTNYDGLYLKGIASIIKLN